MTISASGRFTHQQWEAKNMNNGYCTEFFAFIQSKVR